MSIASPFTLLRESLNPIFENYSYDEQPSQDQLLSLFRMETIEGVQQAESAWIDLYAYKSQPAIVIGDKLAYESGERDMETGRMKAKFYTEQVEIDETERKRIEQNAGRPTRIIERSVEDQLKRQNKYFIKKMRETAILGLTDSGNEDNEIIAMLGASSGGTLTDPSDMNATAGTAYTGTSLIFSGSQQTANNVQQLVLAAKKGMTIIDTDTDDEIPIGQLYLGVDKASYAILSSNTEILNSTTGQRSEKTMLELFRSMGVIVIADQRFDASHTGKTDPDTATWTFFADPGEDCHMFIVPDGRDDSWSDWDSYRRMVKDGTKSQIIYERHKNKEIGFWPQAYWVNSDDTYYKKVWRATVTTYDDSA
jgi:hypothetical protein